LQQPSQTATAQRLSDIDIILVPLVGWDAQGGRLGYGGGYYDRVLTAVNALTVGLGFECQQVMAVPREKHDQLLKVVVSEKQRYRFSLSNTVNA
jgi:5-formyltetrahydrofolate cyclo-ligase